MFCYKNKLTLLVLLKNRIKLKNLLTKNSLKRQLPRNKHQRYKGELQERLLSLL